MNSRKGSDIHDSDMELLARHKCSQSGPAMVVAHARGRVQGPLTANAPGLSLQFCRDRARILLPYASYLTGVYGLRTRPLSGVTPGEISSCASSASKF